MSWSGSRGRARLSASVVCAAVVLIGACAPAAPPAAKPTGAAPKAGAPVTAGAPKLGGTLTFVQRADPTGWDVWGTARTFDPVRSAADMVFSPLIIPTANVGGGCEFTFEGELAESWGNTSPTTLEVKLRRGVRWHNKPPVDGRELVADDVVYSFMERMKGGPSGQTFLGTTILDRVEAVDDHTVRFHFKQPYFGFLEDLYTAGWGWIVPRGSGGPDGKAWLEQPDRSWIGTGPFTFKEYQPGVKMVFDKNPTYFKAGKPYVDGVEMVIMADESTKLASMRAGTLDVYPSSGPRSARDLKRTNAEMQVRSCPSRFVETMNFPLEQAPFNDVRVRQAVSMAINREALARTVLGGEDAHISLLWPLDPEALKLEEFPESARKVLQHNPQEARRLLTDAGFPQGFETKIIYSTTYGSPWNELAEAVVSMLRDVGIRAELDIMEYGAFLRATSTTGQYDVPALRYQNRFSIHDVAANQLWSKSPGPDTTHIKRAPDPELDAMIEELWRTGDAQKHKELAHRIQARVAEQAHVLYTPTWGNAMIAQPWVKNVGWRGNEKFFTNLFDQVWIDK